VAAERQRSWLKSTADLRQGRSRRIAGAVAGRSPRSRGTARSRVDQIWPRRREDDARSVADPLVSPHAPELQDPGGSELSGPAQRHHPARDCQVAPGSCQMPSRRASTCRQSVWLLCKIQKAHSPFGARRQRTTRRLSKASMPSTCCSSQAGPEGHTVVKRCGTPIVYGLFRDASGNELVDDRKCRGLVTAL
jgi:hypothetical protein